jgi:hypothetical protein
MNALEHRTAAAICRCIERRIIGEIAAVADDLADGEFNRRLNGLGARAGMWAIRRAGHLKAAQS